MFVAGPSFIVVLTKSLTSLSLRSAFRLSPTVKRASLQLLYKLESRVL
jgi:hypothetical protein